MATYGEKRLSPQDFEMLFRETDYDGDGLINFDDFVRMMMSKWSEHLDAKLDTMCVLEFISWLTLERRKTHRRFKN